MSKVTTLAGGPHGEADRQGLHLREIPDEAGQPQDSVGEDLRAARLRRGDELGRIARVLRIRKDYLEALESDHPDKLPGRTYAIGFLRSYAEYLGLDTPALVSRHKRQTAGQGETAPQVGEAPELETSRFGFGWPVLIVGVAALLIYGLYEFAKPTVTSPPAASSPAAVSADRSRPPGDAATVGIKPPPRVANEYPSTNTAAAAAAPPSSGTQQTAVPTGQIFGAQNPNARVVLHAHALTHVLVQGFGGKVYMNRLLHPGDVYRVPNVVGLSLTTPNGDAVSLELDGRDMGVAGKAGHITEALSLDPRAILERKGAGGLYEGNKVTQ
jgi:cytoskeleton protein RodZ